MNGDFSELIEYLDGKFNKVDERFEKTAAKEDVAMLVTLEEFDRRVGGLDKKFDEMQKQFSELQTAVDSYAKRADAYFQEMTMLAHKVDRHEKWLQQIAGKLDIKLEYD